MQEYEFTEQELKYINADIFDENNMVYISSIASIKADLPKGKYYILINDRDDCLDLCYHLTNNHKIQATTQTTREDFKFLEQFWGACGSSGVTFDVPSQMTIYIDLPHEHPRYFAHIIYTLRKQAIYNKNLEQEQNLLNL